MRRSLHIAAALVLVATLLIPSAVQAAPAATPIPVLTTGKGEFQPAADKNKLSWEENKKKNPSNFNVYLRIGNGSKIRVNPKGTNAANGGIDGNNLVYQQYKGKDSDIRLYDIASTRREDPPSGINTNHWEFWPSVSKNWVLFGRLKKNGDRKLFIYNLRNSEKRLIAQTSGKKKFLAPGQVNEGQVVYSRCTPKNKCDVFHYDIKTRDKVKLPNPGKFQRAPSVDPNGVVYFIRSKEECGSSVRLMRFKEGNFRKLTRLPDGVDVTDTFTAADGAGLNEVFYENTTCGSAHRADIFKVRDVTGVALKVTKVGEGAGDVTSTPAGINCGNDCDNVFKFGEEVTLTADAADGSFFAGWGGPCSGTGDCIVTMDRARDVTATFDLTSSLPVLSVTKEGTGTVTSDDGNIDCGTDCSHTYDGGEVVRLTATPGANFVFAGWSGGGCSGTATCTVQMSESKEVKASFASNFSLVVFRDGTGNGTVVSDPSGINCGTDCNHTYVKGTKVTLSAFPAADSVFTGWAGACSGTGQCIVTIDQTRSVTAFFTSHRLTVTKTGPGAGTVTSNPAGITCPSDCLQDYRPGTFVQLTANAPAGSKFTGWSGACSGTGSCSVTMDAAKTVTANFEDDKTLTAAKTGAGTGTVTSSPAGIDCGSDCDETYEHGTSVTLTATPDPGMTFVGWSGGGCTGTSPCAVTMDADKTVTATFETEKTITVAKDGDGTGTVQASDPAEIDCGPDCSETYEHGDSVTLTATADPGSSFTGWANCDSPSGNQCTMTANDNKTVTATFTADPPPPGPRQVMGANRTFGETRPADAPGYLSPGGGLPTWWRSWLDF